MRALLVLAVVVLAGCIDPTNHGWTCDPQAPLDEGIRVVIEEPERVVGRCLQSYNADDLPVERSSHNVPGQVLIEVPADGVVWVPTDGPGRYLVRVAVNDWTAGDCVYEWGAAVDWESGVVEQSLRKTRSCA